MLTMTGVKLYLISPVDMYQFFEKEKRGSISYISKKYGKSNYNAYFMIKVKTQNIKNTKMSVICMAIH